MDVIALAKIRKLQAELAAIGSNPGGAITGTLSGVVDGIISGRLGALWGGMFDDGGDEPLIGFPHNRMAFLTQEGGSITASVAPTGGSLDNLFNGGKAGAEWSNPSANISVTVNLPYGWDYQRELMIQFDNAFFPSSFLIEYSKDNGETWITGFDITNWEKAWFCARTSENWYGTTNLRITARVYKFSGYYGITEIGWTNYLFPLDSYSLSKADGGNVYDDINLPDGKAFKINGTNIIELAATEIPSRWRGKVANFLGDSITAGAYWNGTGYSTADYPYPRLLQDMLKLDLIRNKGMFGTTISSRSTSPTDNFLSRYNLMGDADLIVVMGGSNDWANDTPLGTAADTSDISFYGALDVLMDGLIRNNLGKRVVFLTPLPRTDGNNENNAGATLPQYVNAIIEIAAKYSLPVIDTYRMGGLNVNVYEARIEYMNDGIHPNVAGHALLAKNIARQIAAL